MGDFLHYYNQLKQHVPALSPEQSQDFVNQAWRDIRESNDEWSFLFATEYWLSPASISLTGMTSTRNSATILLVHANLPQLGGQSNPALTQRQLKFGLTGGPIYGIAACDVQQVTDGAIVATSSTLTSASAPFSALDVGLLIRVPGAGVAGANLDTTIATYISPTQVTLTVAASTTVSGATVTWGSSITLDRLYREDSSTIQSALCYRIYYSPLTTDFRRLDHLVDPVTGYEFGWQIRSIDELDRMDPRRSSQTQPYQIFFRKYDESTGLPVYELWPGPTIQRAFTVVYWRLGLDFSADTDALPIQLTDELLLMRARILAYEWAMVSDPDRYKRQSFANALGFIRSRYSTEGQPGRPLGLLERAKHQDKSVYLKMFYRSPRNRAVGWPIDSAFMQNHAIPSWLS